jgi:hypothetical protein
MVLRVPPYAGECRFVRVTSVLIFARSRVVLLLCWGERPRTTGDVPCSRLAPVTSAGCPAAGYRPRPRMRRSPPEGDCLPQRDATANRPTSDRMIRSTTTHSNEKSLANISKPRRTPNRRQCIMPLWGRGMARRSPSSARLRQPRSADYGPVAHRSPPRLSTATTVSSTPLPGHAFATLIALADYGQAWVVVRVVVFADPQQVACWRLDAA